MADQLATPEDLASLLQTDDLDRSTAELVLEIATSVVQNACGQRILQVVDDEITLYLDGLDGGEWLQLPEKPVTAISSVLIGATPVTDWTLQASRSRLFRPYGWRSTQLYYPNVPTTATVVYTHGYPVGHQKLQLARMAVLRLASQAVSNPGGAIREQIDDYAIQFADINSAMEANGNLLYALRKQYGVGVNSVRLVKGRHS